MNRFTISESTQNRLKLAEGNSGFSVSVRDDGCVDLYQMWNGDPEQTDYLHICSVDEMIERLQEVKRLAKEKFGDSWE